MNIVMFYNDFSGAYGSINILQNELIKVVNEHDYLYISRSAKETLEICRKCTIDLTLGIGLYYQYIDNVPIYEITKIRHYQWIIDNPLKMSIDEESKYITYILINKDFKYNIKKSINLPLYIPLGYNEKINAVDIKEKQEGIIFCGQIKSCEMNRQELFYNLNEKKIKQFVDKYENTLDESFEKTFQDYFGAFPLNEQKSIFRLCNTYFRAKKRKIVIESIKDYPIFIIGDVLDRDIRKKNNVHILPKLQYMQTWNEVAKYMFSVNINPNFHNAIHDRIIRSIQYGTIPVTEKGEWCYENFGDLIPYYNYQCLSIENIIMNYNYKKYTENIRNLQMRIQNFEWITALKKIKENYNEI